jgi:hypothetical protein
VGARFFDRLDQDGGRGSRAEREVDGSHHQPVGDEGVPLRPLVEEQVGDDGEDGERDTFLDDFKLRHREAAGAEAVGRDLEDVLEERAPPS